MAEGSGLGGQDGGALTPVEKPKCVRVCSEVAVRVGSGGGGVGEKKRKKERKKKSPAVVKDTRMLGSADDNGHG